MASCVDTTDHGFSKDSVLKELQNMFGDVFNSSIIRTVAENYNYDAEKCACMLLELSNGASEVKTKETRPVLSSATSLPALSTNERKSKGQLVIEKALKVILDGYKVLVILRGLPGSGKSHLARYIVDQTIANGQYSTHILSADNFFIKNGLYQYNPIQLSEAHGWNQRKAFESMMKGLSPIIIDNTNTQMWEMKPYAEMATDHGYMIEILEPDTPWKFNPKQLSIKNKHGVPKAKIQEMLERYVKNVTPEKLLSAYNLSYKYQKLPQFRKIPHLISSLNHEVIIQRPNIGEVAFNIPPSNSTPQIATFSVGGYPNTTMTPAQSTTSLPQLRSSLQIETEGRKTEGKLKLAEGQSQLAEGQSQLTEGKSKLTEGKSKLTEGNSKLTEGVTEVKAKGFTTTKMSEPPTETTKVETPSWWNWSKFHQPQQKVEPPKETPIWEDAPSNESNPWIAEFPSASVKNSETINLMDFNEEETPAMVVSDEENDKADGGNPIGVFDISDVGKAWGVDAKTLESWDLVTPVVSKESVARAPTKSWNQIEEVKEKRHAEVNTSEAEFFLYSGCREGPIGGLTFLQSRDRAINTPDKKAVQPKPGLYDKSCSTDEIDPDHYREQHLMELYEMFPRVPLSHLHHIYDNCNKNFEWTVEVLLEDTNEYSDTLGTDVHDPPGREEDQESTPDGELSNLDALNINKTSPQKSNSGSDIVIQPKKSKSSPDTPKTDIESQPSTSGKKSTTDSDLELDDYDSGSERSSDSSCKDMVELNLGYQFAEELEKKFGDHSIDYPKGFQPVVQVPESIAKQLYMLYIESMYQQMDAQNQVLHTIVKEDEAFAKKLQAKEQQESKTPKPTTSISLMEIMDEQIANNLHQKEVESSKGLTTETLAAKLTRQKLCQVFPMVEQNTLIDILEAYDNNYERTVDVLMNSVDLAAIADREALKAPPVDQELFEELKSAEESSKNKEEFDEKKPASFYREEANKHLQKRQELYAKAQKYFQSGMREVALFYSELAQQQTQYYEQANSIAANCFLEEHSHRLQDFDTIDLHYLYVKEAIPALDLFIDRNINLLRGSNRSSQNLLVITGRGNRSRNGVSRIKMAVISRLKVRKIHYMQLNPGLLKINVKRNCAITSDL